MKRKITIIVLILVLLSIIYALLQINSKRLRSYLEKSQKVEANMLVLEAWLPESAIEMANSEIHKNVYDLIVTTGIGLSELDFCMIAMNGYLVFYPRLKSGMIEDNSKHTIDILARSKMGGNYCAHFNIFINDSLISDFNADEVARKFRITWNKPLSDIDSLMVNFTNDLVDDKGDRNLYVKEIIFDSNTVIPYQFNSVFDKGSLGGNDRIKNNYWSLPEVIRNKLIANGIDSSKIVAVTGKRTRINRTLTGAIAFRKWLRESGYKVTGINIISQGIHARRTWMTYKKVMDKSYNIGIISLPESGNSISSGSKNLAIITETLDLIYYWIILLPY